MLDPEFLICLLNFYPNVIRFQEETIKDSRTMSSIILVSSIRKLMDCFLGSFVFLETKHFAVMEGNAN